MRCPIQQTCEHDTHAEMFTHTSGPIHTGRGTRRAMPRKQMGSVNVNGGVHTARKQHQRKNIRICVCIASRVLCGLGLKMQNGDRERGRERETYSWNEKNRLQNLPVNTGLGTFHANEMTSVSVPLKETGAAVCCVTWREEIGVRYAIFKALHQGERPKEIPLFPRRDLERKCCELVRLFCEVQCHAQEFVLFCGWSGSDECFSACGIQEVNLYALPWASKWAKTVQRFVRTDKRANTFEKVGLVDLSPHSRQKHGTA